VFTPVKKRRGAPARGGKGAKGGAKASAPAKGGKKK
jgi:hypothetical protein